MTVRLNIKDNSVNQFLKGRMIIRNEQQDSFINGNTSAYNLMKDVIYLKKDDNIPVGSYIQFELYDIGHNSKRELVNTYNYIVQAYDDFAVKLMLQAFVVNLK